MILRAKKIIQAHLKINKRLGMVMLVYMNVVNYSAIKPSKSACTAQETDINKMKEVLDMYKYEIEEIRAINQDMQEHIDNGHK